MVIKNVTVPVASVLSEKGFNGDSTFVKRFVYLVYHH